MFKLQTVGVGTTEVGNNIRMIRTYMHAMQRIDAGKF
jgi:hypothetical protein